MSSCCRCRWVSSTQVGAVMRVARLMPVERGPSTATSQQGDRASSPTPHRPGLVQHATCGSKQAFPTSPPTPPPHPTPPPPPIPPAPPGLQVPSLTLEQEMIMTDTTGFLRDPSSPIQDADGVWHAWVVWVDPVYGGDLLHSPHSPTRTPTPTLSFHSDQSCSTIVWV